MVVCHELGAGGFPVEQKGMRLPGPSLGVLLAFRVIIQGSYNTHFQPLYFCTYLYTCVPCTCFTYLVQTVIDSFCLEVLGQSFTRQTIHWLIMLSSPRGVWIGTCWQLEAVRGFSPFWFQSCSCPRGLWHSHNWTPSLGSFLLSQESAL